MLKDIPVLKSKLIVPELPRDFVLSQRMEKLFQDMDSADLILVCAPAGYGKTTLAVSYVRHMTPAPRTCWYRLETEDTHVPMFAMHLAEALFREECEAFAESRTVIHEYFDYQYQPHRVVSLLCQEMWAHHDREGNMKTYIVFDDYQKVVGCADIQEMVNYLQANMPPTVTLLILSRVKPLSFSEKLKLDKNILEIGTERLIFSDGEIQKQLSGVSDAVLDRQIVKTVRRITEGWAAGISIIKQAARSTSKEITLKWLEQADHKEILFRYICPRRCTLRSTEI
jgi:LuxR family maltose regulon positive regulatory protein